VLVYDSTDQNGDIKTVGYDFDTKSSFDLGVLPQELPQELPDPDQTGETRALIQNKQTSREGEQEIVDVISGPSPTGTSTSDHTLDLSSPPTQSATTSLSTTIEDVVIESYTVTPTSSQDFIDGFDLVIPPFTATSTE
jgi:hypothetical protein